MEKEHFLDLAKNYTSLSAEDARAVDALQASYPYCQVLHCLASRGAHDHKLDSAAALLALSAVYSTDRAVLKEIMTVPRTVRKQPAVASSAIAAPADAPMNEIIPANEPAVESQPRPVDRLTGDALVKEVMTDLNRLQQLKKMFDTSFSKFTKNHPTEVKPWERAPPAAKRTPEKHPPASPPPKAQKTVAPTVPELTTEPASDSLLSEIETSRKRVFPETRRQKEQQQIIDDFITRQPSISKGVQTNSEGKDLAERSASLTDSMVSETLVEILLRQGKKDKAIEVLRKLIWKFPQKKAIFAAQIEDLRK